MQERFHWTLLMVRLVISTLILWPCDCRRYHNCWSVVYPLDWKEDESVLEQIAKYWYGLCYCIWHRFNLRYIWCFDWKGKPNDVVSFLDTIAKEKIEPFIDKSYKELADYVHAMTKKCSWNVRWLQTKVSGLQRKRYILNAWDVEGVRYKEPSLKIMGIEEWSLQRLHHVVRKLRKHWR